MFHSLQSYGDYCQNFLANMSFRSPWWLSGKESSLQCGRLGLIPGPRRSPGDDNPLQCSCLGHPAPGGCSPWGCKGVRHDLPTKQPHVLYLGIKSWFLSFFCFFHSDSSGKTETKLNFSFSETKIQKHHCR